MITYSGPLTFCMLVCEALKERQRQIKVRSTDFGQCAIEVAYEGISVICSSRADLGARFFELCQMLNTKFKLGLKYQADLGFTDMKVNPPSTRAKPNVDEDGRPMYYTHGPEAKFHKESDPLDTRFDDMSEAAFHEAIRKAMGKPSSMFDSFYTHDKPKRRHYTHQDIWPKPGE